MDLPNSASALAPVRYKSPERARYPCSSMKERTAAIVSCGIAENGVSAESDAVICRFPRPDEPLSRRKSCCTRTSAANAGGCRLSDLCCIADSTAAADISSSQGFWRINIICAGFPRLPVRPSRCRKDATDRGGPNCKTRSSSPMSMPNSIVLVQITQLSPPDAKESSAAFLSSGLTEEW